MKEVIILSHGVDGGINRVSSQLHDYLNRSRSASCTIVKIDPTYKASAPPAAADEILITPKGKRTSGYATRALFWLSSIYRLRRSVDLNAYDVVIFSGLLPFVFYRWLLRDKNKAVFWEHGPQKTWQLAKRVAVFLTPGVRLIVSPSASSLDWLLKNIHPSFNATSVINNWVDTRLIKQRQAYVNVQDPLRIIVCSRIDFKQKDFDVLLRAATILRSDYRLRFEIDVYGQGPDEERLKEAIVSAELKEMVRLRGFSSKPYELYASYDLSVLPSKWEGLPLVVVESIAAGVPCVGAAVVGTVDVITDGVNGYLYRAEDAAELAQRIAEFNSLSHEAKNLFRDKCVLIANERFSNVRQLDNFRETILA